jgi:hypothetical protein
MANQPDIPEIQYYPIPLVGEQYYRAAVARCRVGDVSSAAAQMGKLGGKARAAAMTPERRAEIAKAAAAKRWQTQKT